ncbi:hypothetical protein BDV97DRAFT_42812 [Delphinella strobiligena]|nr:hypothetical protein BDV97DRAFT_42812 [Delphinella strobiligena]
MSPLRTLIARILDQTKPFESSSCAPRSCMGARLLFGVLDWHRPSLGICFRLWVWGRQATSYLGRSSSNLTSSCLRHLQLALYMLHMASTIGRRKHFWYMITARSSSAPTESSLSCQFRPGVARFRLLTRGMCQGIMRHDHRRSHDHRETLLSSLCHSASMISRIHRSGNCKQFLLIVLG